jgi:hypothetical protein
MTLVWMDLLITKVSSESSYPNIFLSKLWRLADANAPIDNLRIIIADLDYL